MATVCLSPFRAWLHARIARTYEHRLAAPERAIEHYRAALGLMPDDQNVFRELVRLLESHRRYDEVVELHERAADDAPNVEVKFAHLFKIGQIFEDLLQAPDRALAVYRRILAERADHFGAFFALQRAAGRAGAHDALVEALLQEAAAHSTPEDKLALLHRAGEVTLEHLGKVTEAVELFGQVLAIDKHYAPTLASLSNLYERDGRHKELLKVLGLQLVALDSEREKAEQLLRMGRLCEDALGDDEKALALYSRAYELLPDDISSRAVRRTLGRLERNEELSTFLIESLKAMAPGPDRARLFTSLGQLYEMKLQKLQAALVAYEKALEDQPDLITALDGRIRVLEQRGDPVKTAEALEQRAASTSDPAVRLWAALRRGELMETFDRSGQHGLQIVHLGGGRIGIAALGAVRSGLVGPAGLGVGEPHRARPLEDVEQLPEGDVEQPEDHRRRVHRGDEHVEPPVQLRDARVLYPAGLELGRCHEGVRVRGLPGTGGTGRPRAAQPEARVARDELGDERALADPAGARDHDDHRPGTTSRRRRGVPCAAARRGPARDGCPRCRSPPWCVPNRPRSGAPRSDRSGESVRVGPEHRQRIRTGGWCTPGRGERKRG